MIHFRQPNQDIGYIVMCQVFIALGGGAVVITEQLAAMAATSHQYVAVVLAVEAMFAYIGGAVGDTIASAMWTGIFPGKLREFLPEGKKADYLLIYEDLTEQLSYPVGSPTRTAIIDAYGVSQLVYHLSGTFADERCTHSGHAEVHAYCLDGGADSCHWLSGRLAGY